MNKKIHKTKKQKIKLTPPQRDHLKSGQKESVASKDASEEMENGNTSPQEQPLEEKKQNDSPAAPLEEQDGEVKETPETPVESDKPLKKKSFLKALHKKTPRKPTKNPLEEEVKTLESRYLYLKADFENYKKQMFKERGELARYGGEEFIRALIEEVLDDFDRAYGNFKNTKSLENFKSGIDLIYKNLQKTLNKFHIKAEDPKGQPFDPRCHEALSRQSTDKVPKDHVLVTFKKAYTLYEKLIRPAQVIVAIPPKDSSEVSEEDSIK